MNLFRSMAGAFCCVFGLTLLSVASANAAPDPNFHIYIAYGQSNMAGAAKDFTDLDKAEHPRYKMFATTSCSNLNRPTVGEIYPAVPPMFHCYEGLSVADWFGRNMADSLPDVTIGVIPVAVGGASIQLFEPSNYQSYLASAESWLVNWAKDYGTDGNAMGRIIEIAKKAQEVGVIKGFIFHQGETDGGMSDWETRVAATYEYMLKELGLNAEETPFVAGEMVAGGACDGMRTRVRALSSYIANFGVAKSDDLPGASDRLHFTVEGYRGMGERYAQEMLKLVNVTPVEPVPQEPFYGTATKAPGKLEVEDYDKAGIGTDPETGASNASFNDKTSDNAGKSTYRNDAVDLYDEGTGVVLGMTEEGEWLEYTMDFEEGEYTIDVFASSGTSTSKFQLMLDGENLGAEVEMEQTADNDWSVYKTVSVDAGQITAGTHVFKLLITGNYVNIDYFEFKKKSAEIPEQDTSSTDAIRYGSALMAPKAMNMENVQYFDMQGNRINKSAMQKNGIYLVRIPGQKSYIMRTAK